MRKLSICFTVYNQSDLLKKRLEQIVEYKRDDIEIVISDDCSTENIKKLVDGFRDDRIKYYKTPKNLGHDLNIIHGIKCCLSNYIYLFRTRDNIVVTSIDKIIKCINKNPDIGFYYFSAIDENGNKRLTFKDCLYRKGKDTFEAYQRIPDHPSGNLYNKKYLDLDIYESYIQKYFDDIYGFTVHKLIKCDISVKADFLTSSIVGWMYSDTLQAKDVAVNKIKNGINVYDPKYCYPRYKCEFNFAKQELPDDILMKYLLSIVYSYYHLILFRVPLLVNDERYMSHYNSDSKIINIKTEFKNLNKITKEMIIDLNNKQKMKINKVIRIEKLKLKTIYPILKSIRNYFLETPVYSVYRNILGQKKR